MTALLTAVFVASLIGSLHCAGMCGGVVTLCVGGTPLERRSRWSTPIAYNLGRLVTYAALGMASGAIGAAIDLGGAGLGVSRVAAMVAGATMIGIGLVALLRTRGVRFGHIPAPAWLTRGLRRATSAANALPPAPRAAAIGLLTGFLPCGWLYAFVITAAGTGSAVLGGLTMVAFWAGTVPILVAIGVGVDAITAPLRRHVPTVTAAAIIVIGVVAVTGRLNAPAYAETIAAAANASEDATTRVESLDAAAMPCCNDTP